MTPCLSTGRVSVIGLVCGSLLGTDPYLFFSAAMTAPAVAVYNAAEWEIVAAIEAWEYVTLRTPEVRDYLERLLVADVRSPFVLFFPCCTVSPRSV